MIFLMGEGILVKDGWERSIMLKKVVIFFCICICLTGCRKESASIDQGNNETAVSEKDIIKNENSAPEQINESDIEKKQDITLNDNDSKDSGHSKDEIEDFAKKVIELIENDERQELADIIQYPLNINLDGKKIYIKDKDAFLENYSLIFNDKFKLQIKDADTENVWGNSVGYIIGNGDIWFANDSSDGKLKIIAINSGNGEMPKDGEGYGITPG
jgi:hypothetical protein